MASSLSPSSTEIPNPFQQQSQLQGHINPFSTSPLDFMKKKQKRTWSDLQLAVKNTRRLNLTLSNKVLSGFTFRHVYPENGKRVTRVYFLGVPPYNAGFVRESFNTLMYVDVPSHVADHTEGQQPVVPSVEWHPLLESFYTSSQSYSKEETLLRERKRVGSFGITSYDVDIQAGKFLFPACGTLFSCMDVVYENQLIEHSVFPLEIKTKAGTKLDANLCPSNCNLVAFISSNDLWIANSKTGHDRRLTFLYKGGAKLADNPRSAGVPPFVIQEEFDRYTGYWWQPCQQPGNGNVYRILYEEADESNVPILNISSPSSKGADIEEHRYPRPGQANARSHLRLLQFELDEQGNVHSVSDRQLPDTLYRSYPDMEYLIRAGWTPDGKYVWAQILNRLQTKLQLILIPLDSFSIDSSESAESSDLSSLDSSIEKDEEMKSLNSSINNNNIQLLYEETNDIWLNVHDNMYFLEQENDSELSFIWSSEKSGFRHLYLISVPIPQCPSASVIESNSDLLESANFKVNEEVQLTSGDWAVLPKEVFVDQVRKLVYFTGLKDTVLESHFYVVSYGQVDASEPLRLTKLGSSHTVYMDKQCEMFVTVNSNIKTPTSSQIYGLKFNSSSSIENEGGNIECRLLCNLNIPPPPVSDYHPPELFTYNSMLSGHQMHGMVFKPHHIEAGCVYPTMLFVYGGPQVQIVSNSFKGLRYLRLHTMASLGYVVIAIDSRGSANRGLEFESAIKDRLGHVEITDQIEGLEWLASQVDYIDISRVAIHGSSYGGYLSLMGLAKRPDIFKVAIAVSPVTSWNLYDTGYTERYLKLPTQGTDSYSCSSVLELSRLFPSDENRLLIVHGLMDENVHFYHTSSLIEALVKAGKPYQLQVYPNERHGIRNAECSEHYETMVLSFFEQHL